jgi:hypothetical protein
VRDLIVLVAICLVVAGAAWFLLGGSPHNLLQTHPDPVTVNPSTPAPDPKAVKPAQSKKGKQEHGAPGATALTAQEQEAPSPSSATSVVPPEIKSVPAGRTSSRVPTTLEIRIGAEGVDVIRRFGAPLASAYTVDDGHYFETYFYRGERSQATIHLRDGKVYSVFPR